MLRLLREWALVLVLGVGFGLGVAWLEQTFGIPKHFVQWFWIALMVAALGFVGWVAWAYYSVLRDEDDWD
jgi:hypothetical protein